MTAQIHRLVCGTAAIALALSTGCTDWDSKEAPKSFTEAPTAAPQEEGAAPVPSVDLEKGILGILDEALEQAQNDPTSDLSSAHTELADVILAMPETKNAEQIQAQYEVLMARFDGVLSTTRTPEARAPIGELKRTANQAFEKALSAEYARGGDDAAREAAAEAARMEAEAKAEAERLAAEANAIAEEAAGGDGAAE